MENFLLPQCGLHQGLFTTALRPETRQQLVAVVADIAAFARIALEAPHKSDAQVLEIASDELTAGEMAEALWGLGSNGTENGAKAFSFLNT